MLGLVMVIGGLPLILAVQIGLDWLLGWPLADAMDHPHPDPRPGAPALTRSKRNDNRSELAHPGREETK